MKTELNNLTGAELVRVHLRGRRVDLLSARLDLGRHATDGKLRSAVERELGFEPGALAEFRVCFGQNGNRTLRPRRVKGAV